jgi:hypothetical protein
MPPEGPIGPLKPALHTKTILNFIFYNTTNTKYFYYEEQQTGAV